MAHGLLYTFKKFKLAIENDKCATNKIILNRLCLLFGAHVVLNFGTTTAENGLLLPNHIQSLKILKENLLELIRPELAGLLDSFMIPEKMIRSALAKGNPYQNYL